MPEVEEAEVVNGRMLLNRREGCTWLWKSECRDLRTGGDRMQGKDFAGAGLSSQAK